MWNMKVILKPILVGSVPKGLEKKTRGTGHQKKNQDHPDYSVVKIGHSDFSERPPIKTGVKNSQEVK